MGSDDDMELTKKHAPVMIPLAQNRPTKFLKNFYSKPHDATSHYRLWTVL